MKKIVQIILLIILPFTLFGQRAVIKGVIADRTNNTPLAFVNVLVQGTNIGATSDIDGNFRIEGINPGTYNVIFSSIGYKQKVEPEIYLTSNNIVSLNVLMEPSVAELSEVEVQASPFQRSAESPVSLKSIGLAEIYRNPGGNRDISKVVQTLPGVGATVAFRNDLIVRGGAPGENKFFLDDVEIPTINHFATQGSSGGPVGIINVNFLRGVDFYSGAFPANRGDALSSILSFKQIEGNNERILGNFMIGSSDVGLTLEGPLSKKTTFVASARRSYLQFLFQALALPFLPTYNDFQFKTTTAINDKNKLTFLGLGAVDNFRLNKSVNDGLDDSTTIERNEYILGNLPVNEQWNYTLGARWQNFFDGGVNTVVASRSHLNNSTFKYLGNTSQPQDLIYNYESEEIIHKVRAEQTRYLGDVKVNYGVGSDWLTYKNNTFRRVVSGGSLIEKNVDSEVLVGEYYGFGSVSNAYFSGRLRSSFGLRLVGSDYNPSMANPIENISPRASLSYALMPKVTLNANVGRYVQMPAATVLGYRDSLGNLVNQENRVKYTKLNQAVAGIEFLPTEFSKISIEAFYKRYYDYPLAVADSVSLANLGADFGVIGNEDVVSESEGRAYGFELYARQTLTDKIYGILSYTLVWSEFTNGQGEFIPSAWDNRHIVNATLGRKLKKGWEVGVKFRLLGGAPITPYDRELTAQKEVWNVSRQGIPDYDRLNSERLPLTHAMDLRVDKKWDFDRVSVNLYFDIQNAYGFQAELQPFLTVQRDKNGAPIEDPNDSSKYLLKEIPNQSGAALPSIGLMVTF